MLPIREQVYNALETHDIDLRREFDPKEVVDDISRKFGISSMDMKFIIEHEGGWPGKECRQSDIIDKKGKRENSWGPYQINLDHNPRITKEQACDFIWASEWTAKQLSENRFYLWTSIKNQN